MTTNPRTPRVSGRATVKVTSAHGALTGYHDT